MRTFNQSRHIKDPRPQRFTVKKALSAHAVVGLTTGVLMYLICLTGSLAVFKAEFERWEQPAVEIISDWDAGTVTKAITHFQAEVNAAPESLFVVFPAPALPYIHVADEHSEYWLNRDGTLGAQVTHGWTAMLAELHINLHLPETIGLVLVSALGAMLASLIVSGVLAHPHIVRDALRLRLGGDRQLEQTDIHNRLSVWGLPFHLMISITGGFFGLVALLVAVAAPLHYDGDRDALIADIYGADPLVDADVRSLDIQRVMAELEQHAPGTTPLYLVVQKIGTRGQFIEVAAALPGRLSYSEIYRFGADGAYLGKQGLTDGPVSRQVIYSVYRLHFGNFAGTWTKLAYLLMGMALTVITVSGINIWLAKRGGRDGLNALWESCVWGVPLALACSAVATVLSGIDPLPVFIGTVSLAVLYLYLTGRKQTTAPHLQWITSGLLLLLLIGHALRFGFLAGGKLIPALLMLTALLLVLAARRGQLRGCSVVAYGKAMN